MYKLISEDTGELVRDWDNGENTAAFLGINRHQLSTYARYKKTIHGVIAIASKTQKDLSTNDVKQIVLDILGGKTIEKIAMETGMNPAVIERVWKKNRDIDFSIVSVTNSKKTIHGEDLKVLKHEWGMVTYILGGRNADAVEWWETEGKHISRHGQRLLGEN